MIRLVGALFAVLLLSNVAVAQGVNCSGTQAEMNQCAANSFKVENEALKHWYQRALDAAQDDEARKMLAAAQVHWVAFRDVQCKFDGDIYRGGTMQPLMAFNCKTSLTQGRVAQMQALVNTGYGSTPGWSESLFRFLQQYEDSLPTGIYWNSAGWASADFDGDGDYDEAFLGLLPGTLMQPESQYVVAVTLTGTNNLYWDRFVVGDDGLCSPEVELHVEYYVDELPVVAVEDGACDAYRIQMQPGGVMETFRN